MSEPTFDLLDLRKNLTDSAKSAVEKFARAKIEGALQDHLSGIFLALSSELLPAVLGSITKAWLGVLLGTHDKLNRKLDILIRTPLDAGSRAAQEALALDPRDEDEERFREQRLEFALNQLEIALADAKAQKQPDWELYYIIFLQGLCAREMRGGRPYATPRLTTVADAVMNASRELAHHAGQLSQLAEICLNDAEYFETEGDRPHYYLGRGAGTDPAKKARRNRAGAEKYKREAQETAKVAGELAAVAEILKRLALDGQDTHLSSSSQEVLKC